MSKFATLFTAALLLFFTLTCSARSVPAFSSDSSVNTQLGDAAVENVEVEASCEGLGKAECLERRTLTAHIDYIYTQKHN